MLLVLIEVEVGTREWAIYLTEVWTVRIFKSGKVRYWYWFQCGSGSREWKSGSVVEFSRTTSGSVVVAGSGSVT